MHTNKFLSRFVTAGTRLVVFVAMVAALLSSVTPAAAAAVTIDLCATTGSTTLPNGASVPVWGYVLGDCTGSPTVSVPGGPTLTVNQGDDVTIVLHNALHLAMTGLLFQGQAMIPDRTGVLPNGTKTYTFTASRPGTYLYEAGLLPGAQYQTAMGLYGALIVLPTSAPDVVIPGQAYADVSTAFDDEAVLVLSEIDPALNTSASSSFDMRNYNPRYFLINGKVYTSTNDIPTAAGNRVLLRYLNAGIKIHSMAVLGLHQTVIANDGSPLAHSHRMVAESFGSGQTVDTIVTIPAAAVDGIKFAIYDGNLMLRNSNVPGFGGMLTFLTVSAPPPPTDTVGPVTSGVAYSAGTLNATVSDAATGGNNVSAAEYYLDSTSGTGTAMSGAFGTATVSVSASVAVPSGSHTLYVRGQDSLGNWGAFSSVLVNGGDTTGPATTGLTLTSSPTNGSASVALNATGNDTASGGSNITAAEYTIDGGAAVPMNVNVQAPIASLNATIPAATVNALLEGAHVVSVRSRDAANNWGAPATVNLVVDKTAPNTSSVSAAPNPNNGTLPINQDTLAVRVSATLTDPTSGGVQSNISAAEGFICTTPAVGCAVGANGTGFVFSANDGAFNSSSESASSDIPLATIIQLSNGNHTIYVHARDAAGNWGATSNTLLLIDKIAPAIISINRSDPNPTSAATVNFLVTFSEAVNGVTSANFTLASGPGLTGAAITSVTGSGATRTVTVSTGTGGGGTLGLNLTSATGITDLAGNALPTTGLPFVGQIYTQPSPSLYFSTFGNSNPPGVGGTSDDADIYFWSGTVFSRTIDVTAITNPLPAGANVDGFDRVSATQFYMSFNGGVTVPGIAGTVQDEDIVMRSGTTWSLYFDGSANGLTSGNFDLDAISIVGAGGPGNVYFSTDNGNTPPSAGGTGDDADIYRWNGGSSYTRVVNANGAGSLGLPTGANVDGFVWVDGTHFYMSFTADTAVPGLGTVEDEDVVYYNNGVWSVFFNGTARGLTSANLDIDAFDLP